MAFKIAFIGAGSIEFSRRLLHDILAVPEFKGIQIAFTDINEENLEKVRQLCQRDMEANGLDIRIEATVDRRKAIEGARYVMNMVRVGGLEAFEHDVSIPLKYGVDQCVGDTICAGGLMYAQRGIPVILSFCKDIAELAEPGAILFNYSNPMAMMTWAANKYGHGVKTVGLCHGVQHGHRLIAEAFALPHEEVDYSCLGINHQTWYTRISHKGKDLTGELLKQMEAHPRISKTEKTRIDVLRRFGCFSTETNGHLSEYLAWYRKRPGETANWIDDSEWYHGRTGGYLETCRANRHWFETEFPKLLQAEPLRYDRSSRSVEHVSYIIEGLETGRPYRGHFNMPNNGTILNLPHDAIIEAPGYVDRNGISMTANGELPLGCAAICQQSIDVQRMGMEAAVHGNIDLLRQAMLMDPLTGAVCTPPEVWQMVDEMLLATANWLPQYTQAIASIRDRKP